MTRFDDWNAVRAYYDRGNSLRQCMRRFGFSRVSWYRAVHRGEIKPRPCIRPIVEMLAVAKSRTNVKRRLLQAGLLQNRCGECGLEQWLGERLTIQIDHVNGIGDDYRLENLRMLCPNCHSQTETYGNKKRR
jgi:5-methylcytosine-specific restriction endonuclease McrA